MSVELACGMGPGAMNYVLFNTVLTALEIYVMPFIVIVICYGTIMSTIMKEEKHIQRGTVVDTIYSSYCTGFMIKAYCVFC